MKNDTIRKVIEMVKSGAGCDNLLRFVDEDFGGYVNEILDVAKDNGISGDGYDNLLRLINEDFGDYMNRILNVVKRIGDAKCFDTKVAG